MNKLRTIAVVMTLCMVLVPARPVFAHVVIKPSEAGIGTFQTFTTGVPNEKDTPTTGLRILIPNGLKYISPTVKPGWTITVKKIGEAESEKITEIEWSGGLIPQGQRDDFSFSAQVPATQTTLVWKAYQTYEDGEIVAWDQAPQENNKDKPTTPYSTTKIINDLAETDVKNQPQEAMSKDTVFSIVAVGLSALALGLSLRKKSN